MFTRRVGPWTLTEDGCGAYRAYFGTDGSLVKNRVAFIEKTPRIRIRDAVVNVPAQLIEAKLVKDDCNLRDDAMNWAFRRFKGSGPEDQASRKWCDDALRLFGYFEWEEENPS